MAMTMINSVRVNPCGFLSVSDTVLNGIGLLCFIGSHRLFLVSGEKFVTVEDLSIFVPSAVRPRYQNIPRPLVLNTSNGLIAFIINMLY